LIHSRQKSLVHTVPPVTRDSYTSTLISGE
jgi:hypothetical protein